MPLKISLLKISAKNNSKKVSEYFADMKNSYTFALAIGK